jgi:DUF1365 family protein
MVPGIKSHLYECSIMHHRLAPRQYRFRHPIFLFCLDLDEVQALSNHLALFSHNRFNVYSFHDKDHLAGKGETVKDNLIHWLRNKGVDASEKDRILLLTFPRVLGYTFNPVSFYFCLRPSGEALCAVAEVGNTFGEFKRYLVPRIGDRDSTRFVLDTPKEFYVSPFMPLDVRFEFRLQLPGGRLALRVLDHAGKECLLTTSLSGRQRNFNASNLARFLVRYPLMTLRVILLIHWHAMKLYLKKIPYIQKAAQPEQQVDVMRPHASLIRDTK